MDLALQLGMTTGTLARTMTERELGEWAAYRARRMLPQRRIELMLANIALLIDVRMGGVKNAKLNDYLFEPALDAAVDEAADASDGDELTAEDIAAQFGSTVYRKKG